MTHGPSIVSSTVIAVRTVSSERACEARAFPSGGSFSVTPGDKSASQSVNVGTKHALEGAFSVRIDQDPPILISHTECLGLHCGGKLEIDNGFTERLERSRTVAIEATTTAGQKINVSLSLVDFATAYDGP